jgi:hypothetical protein
MRPPVDVVTAIALTVGGVFGVAGTFVPHDAFPANVLGDRRRGGQLTKRTGRFPPASGLSVAAT